VDLESTNNRRRRRRTRPLHSAVPATTVSVSCSGCSPTVCVSTYLRPNDAAQPYLAARVFAAQPMSRVAATSVRPARRLMTPIFHTRSDQSLAAAFPVATLRRGLDTVGAVSRRERYSVVMQPACVTMHLRSYEQLLQTLRVVAPSPTTKGVGAC